MNQQEIAAAVQPLFAELPGMTIRIFSGNSLNIRGASNGGISLALLGTDFVALLYGEAFACAPEVMALLAVGCGIRLLRAVPTTVLVAFERTSTAMLCNLPRVAALPVAFAVLSGGGSIASVVLIGAVSEGLGLALGLKAVHGLRSAQPIPALNGATSPT